MNESSGAARVQVRYTGRVQGVGFRYRVRELAVRRSVTGFVMNYPDGSVVMVAEGPEPDVQGLLDDVIASPMSAFIRGSQSRWAPARHEFADFRIREFER